MKNFEEIIKKSAEQFEVPFNDAHWAEMDSKLNAIKSKKKNTILFGSATTVIVLLISAYFLTPSSSNINSEKQIQPKEVSNGIMSPTEMKPQVSVSDTKEEVDNNKIEIPVKLKPKNPTAAQVKKKEYKTKGLITPTIVAEKQEALINEKPVVSNKNLKKEVEPSLLKEKETSTSPSKIAIATTSTIKEPQTHSASKIKTIRHKAYEDENVSKKNIKRRRGNIFRFLSFKKKRYKVPLSRKKTSKRKK